MQVLAGTYGKLLPTCMYRGLKKHVGPHYTNLIEKPLSPTFKKIVKPVEELNVRGRTVHVLTTLPLISNLYLFIKANQYATNYKATSSPDEKKVIIREWSLLQNKTASSVVIPGLLATPIFALAILNVCTKLTLRAQIPYFAGICIPITIINMCNLIALNQFRGQFQKDCNALPK